MKKNVFKKILFGGLLVALTLVACLTNFSGGILADTASTTTSEAGVVHLLNTPSDKKFSYFSSFTNSGLEDDNGNKENRWLISYIPDPTISTSSASGSGSYTLSSDLQKIAKAAELSVYASFSGWRKSGSDANVRFTIDNTKGSTASAEIGNTSITGSKTGSVAISKKSNNEITKLTNSVEFSYSAGEFTIVDPCLNFVATINSITSTLDDIEGTIYVYAGQQLTLNASNAILDLDGGSMLDKFKEAFAISWEITKGGDYASIEDGVLTVNSDVAAGSEITVKASCIKSNGSSDKKIEKTFTFTVGDVRKVVSNVDGALSNIDIDENASTFTAILNEGYEFVNETGKNEGLAYYESERKISGTVSNNSTVVVAVKKQVTISEIILKDKYYDGTTTAEIEKIIFAEGGSVSSINGLEINFESADAGSVAKVVVPEGGLLLTLGDADAAKYTLKTDVSEDYLNSLIANCKIQQADVIVAANKIEQTYGESAEEITYTTIPEGVTLSGALARLAAANKNAATYNITIGTLNNPNYNIIFRSNKYIIKEKEIVLHSVSFTKTYDGTTSIENATKTAKYGKDGEYNDFNEAAGITGDSNKLTITFKGTFKDKGVGENKKIENFSVSLSGIGYTNYKITKVEDATISGKIEKRPVTIVLKDVSKVYGDEDPSMTGNDGFTNYAEYEEGSLKLVSGDNFSGSLTRKEGETVGDYIISVNTFGAGDNYLLTIKGTNGGLTTKGTDGEDKDNATAKFTIEERQVDVKILYSTKYYLGADPDFSKNVEITDCASQTVEKKYGDIKDTYGLKIKVAVDEEKEESHETVGKYALKVTYYDSANYEVSWTFENKVKDSEPTVGEDESSAGNISITSNGATSFEVLQRPMRITFTPSKINSNQYGKIYDATTNLEFNKKIELLVKDEYGEEKYYECTIIDNVYVIDESKVKSGDSAIVQAINGKMGNDNIVSKTIEICFADANVGENKNLTYKICYATDDTPDSGEVKDADGKVTIAFDDIEGSQEETSTNILIKGNDRIKSCYSITYSRPTSATINKRKIQVYLTNLGYALEQESGENVYYKQWADADPDFKFVSNEERYITYVVVDYEYNNSSGEWGEVKGKDDKLDLKDLLKNDFSENGLSFTRAKQGEKGGAATGYQEDIGIYVVGIAMNPDNHIIDTTNTSLSSSVETDNLTIELRDNQTFEITKRYIIYEPVDKLEKDGKSVTVTDAEGNSFHIYQEKTYGEEDGDYADPENVSWSITIPTSHTYTANQLISGKLTRNEGEAAGIYQFTTKGLVLNDGIYYTPTEADTVLYDFVKSVQAGPNGETGFKVSDYYQIVLTTSYFRINPRKISIDVDTIKKVYGELEKVDGEHELTDVKWAYNKYTFTRGEGDNAITYTINDDKTEVTWGDRTAGITTTYTFKLNGTTYTIDFNSGKVAWGGGSANIEKKTDNTYTFTLGEGDDAITYTINDDKTEVTWGESQTTNITTTYTFIHNNITYTIDFNSGKVAWVANETENITKDSDTYTFTLGEGDDATTYTIDFDNKNLTWNKETKSITENTDNTYTFTLGEGVDAIIYTINSEKTKITWLVKGTANIIDVLVKNKGVVSQDSSVYWDDSFVFYIDWEAEYGAYNVGTHKFTVKIIDDMGNDRTSNYSIIPNGTFTITQRPITVTIVDNALKKTYGEEDPNWTNLVEKQVYMIVTDSNNPNSGLAYGENLKDILTGSAKRKQGESVGEYEIFQNVLTTNNNYVLTFIQKQFEIIKKSIKVQANSQEMFVDQYEEAIENGTFKLTYTISSETPLVDGDTESGALALETTPDVKNDYVGKYNILLGDLKFGNDDGKNYEIEFSSGTLTIRKRNVKITVGTQTKPYDGKGLGLEQGKFSVSGIGEDKIKEGHGDEFFKQISIVIPKVTTITSGNSFSAVVDENATFYIGTTKYTLNSLEDPTKVSFAKNIPVSEATFNFDGVIYTIVFNSESGKVEKVTADDFEASVLNNKFSIGKTEFTLDSDENPTKVSYTYEIEVFSGKTFTVEDGNTYKINFSTTTSSKDVGIYNISLIIPEEITKYYECTVVQDEGSVNLYCKITRKQIEISTTNASKTYDGKIYEKTKFESPTVTGLVVGETINFDFSGNTQVNAGTYKIDLLFDGLSVNDYNRQDGKNYTITYTPGSLTISRQEITISTDDPLNKVSKTYDGIAACENISFVQPTITKGQLVEGETIVYDFSRNTQVNAGTYKIDLLFDGLSVDAYNKRDGKNYKITYTAGTYTIEKRRVYFEIIAHDKVYNGKDNVVTDEKPNIVNVVEGDNVSGKFEARFKTIAVGEAIPIIITNRRIVDETDVISTNYEVIQEKEQPVAAITYESLSAEGITVTVVDKENNTSLRAGTTLEVEWLKKEDIKDLENGTNVEGGFIIKLVRDGEVLTDFGKLTVEVDHTLTPVNDFNFFIANETIEKVDHKLNDEQTLVSFETSQLGTIVMASPKNLTWVYVLCGVGGAGVLGGGIWLVIFLVKKYKYG